MNDQSSVKPKISKLAIVSFVCSLTCIGALVGLILGIVAAIQIRRHKSELKGMDYAVAGIALGAVGIFLSPLFMPTCMPRSTARLSKCISNLKQVEAAAIMYADDHNSKFPAAVNWNITLKPYMKSPAILICPADETGGPSYAINSRLAGISDKAVKMPSKTVLIFESEPGKNRVGGPELIPAKPRHTWHGEAWDIIGYADGHVTPVAVERVKLLNWNPK